jgi:polyhydroxybutyrate depolymerase
MQVTSLAFVLASFVVSVAACSSSSGSSDAASPASPDSGATLEHDGGSEPAADAAEAGELGGDRPVTLHVPPGYSAGVAAPLVILLHGYSASGAVQDLYFGLTAVSDARGFLYAHPDGLVDADGKRYWNASDACCDFAKTNVDDSTYISTLIKQVQARYTVDPKRIFLIGHSNGGFMSYRMACDHSDQIAAIASLAGAATADLASCKPTSPVSVLQIHGTEDQTIAYDGGQIAGRAYPSAKTSVTTWASLDGCSTTPDNSSAPLDLEAKLAGNETTVVKYAAGCKPGGHAELWTIAGGAHIPSLTKSFTTSVVDFLYAHPKP